MYRKIKDREVRESDNYTMTKYREIRGMYEIDVIREKTGNFVAAQFSNFTDLNLCVKFNDAVDPFGYTDITFGNVEFPNRVAVDELALIGEELIKIKEFISSVRRDQLHNSTN